MFLLCSIFTVKLQAIDFNLLGVVNDIVITKQVKADKQQLYHQKYSCQ